MKTKFNKKILKKIIEIESLSQNHTLTLKTLNLIKQKILTLEIPVQIINKNSFPILIAGNLLNAKTLFLSHIDIVPGNKEQFVFKQNGDKIFGRGAVDMKGPLISSLGAFTFLWKKGIKNIIFCVTSDEEIGGFNGVQLIKNKFLNSIKLAIVPDSTSKEQIVLIQKAPFHVKIACNGKSSHGSRPWEGINALEKISKCSLKIVNNLNGNTKDITSAALTQLHGGNATNVIPDSAFSTIDIRIKSKKEVNNIIKIINMFTKKENCEWKRIDKPLFVDVSNKINSFNKWPGIHKFTTESGTSDARFLSSMNIPILITSAIGEGAHTQNEWVSEKSLEKLQNNIIKFLLE